MIICGKEGRRICCTDFTLLSYDLLHGRYLPNQCVKNGFRTIVVSLPCSSNAANLPLLESSDFLNESGHVEKLVSDVTVAVWLQDFGRSSCGDPKTPSDCLFILFFLFLFFEIAIVRQRNRLKLQKNCCNQLKLKYLKHIQVNFI